jgi:hypothetical protein
MLGFIIYNLCPIIYPSIFFCNTNLHGWICNQMHSNDYKSIRMVTEWLKSILEDCHVISRLINRNGVTAFQI